MDSQATGKCSNDTIIGTSVGISGGCYISQINVTVTSERINETIMCVHRDIYDQNTIIGQTILEITMGKLRAIIINIHTSKRG
jgi:tagatose-1,6-bisphosphate aldolase non-catalytic subunit AgaZ/GatZ